MISVRPALPESSVQSEQTQSRDGGLIQNLFAGLTFPEVPTGAIRVPSNSCNQNVAEAPPAYPGVEEQPSERTVESPPVQEARATEPPTVRTAQSLACLYSSKEIVPETISAYPDLPISIVTSAHQDEYTEAAHLTAPDVTVPQQAEATHTEASCPDDMDREGSLISDLIAENARLSAEVDQLRRARTQPPPSSSSSLVDGVATGARHDAMTRGDRGEEQEGLLQPQTDTAVGLKYVCCGGCRTWLSAPKDALYVRCPGCEAINNCSPQAPQQAIAREMPWLNNCFSHFFS